MRLRTSAVADKLSSRMKRLRSRHRRSAASAAIPTCSS